MKRLLICCGLLLLGLNVRAAELTATLDRNAIHQTETVQLIIRLNGYDSSGNPDLKPLMRDFEVLGSAKSNQVSIINGHANQQLQWQITIAPRHSGAITIPALQVGSMRTSPLTLVVTKAASQPGKSDKLFLEVAAKPKQAFMQSQVLYTARLYIAEPLQGGSLTDPVVPNAIMLRLGTDSNYQTTRNGRRYEVIERRYGIFPQKSGTMVISPPTFLGQMLVDNNPDPFFPQLRPVRLTAQPIELMVKEKPPNIASDSWLPAQDITVNETWSAAIERWPLGEPVTRTLTLSGVGLGGEQLADLSKLAADGFNVYAAMPKVATTVNDRAVLGQRVVKLTYIPIKTGTLTIPAVRIPWWSTTAQKEQLLVLPERQVTITQSNTHHTDLSTVSPTKNIVSAIAKKNEKAPLNYGPWLITAAVTIAWLTTLLVWWRQRKQPRTAPYVNEKAQISDAIKKACQQNNPQAAKSALLAWASTVWPQQIFRCLADIVTMISSAELKAKLTELDTILYSEQGFKWDGAAFWNVFKHTSSMDNQKVTEKPSTLPPLYPE